MRPSARLLLLDSRGRVLLFRFTHADGALAGRTYWATPGEREVMAEHRWWSRDELAQTNDVVFPENILEMLAPFG